MEQQSEEIRQIITILPADVHKQFITMYQNCMRTRGYGLEYTMDYGRALGAMRSFLKTYAKHHADASFDKVCASLEIDPSEARHKIVRSICWDNIKEHRDENDSSVRMPEIESHVRALVSAIDREDVKDAGRLWAQYYKEATENQAIITAAHIASWMENYKALPVQSETVTSPIRFEDEVIPIAGAVSPGVPVAAATEVTAGTVSTEAPGEGPEFKHPPEVLEAIERIVNIVSPNDAVKQAEWRRLLSDTLKIKFALLLEWANEDEETILRIARLIHGDLGKGLRAAIRIAKGVVDNHTRLSHLENLCLAEGGRWEHIDGSFRIIITKLKDSL